ncbi:MAG TPA: hypothetical protein VKA94_10955, partial [Hyphomicrobiales bacterium]|nr:hypothetical protein [Hyphomicrobiales bacterium]
QTGVRAISESWDDRNGYPAVIRKRSEIDFVCGNGTCGNLNLELWMVPKVAGDIQKNICVTANRKTCDHQQ